MTNLNENGKLTPQLCLNNALSKLVSWIFLSNRFIRKYRALTDCSSFQPINAGRLR